MKQSKEDEIIELKSHISRLDNKYKQFYDEKQAAIMKRHREEDEKERIQQKLIRNNLDIEMEKYKGHIKTSKQNICDTIKKMVKCNVKISLADNTSIYITNHADTMEEMRNVYIFCHTAEDGKYSDGFWEDIHNETK